MPIPQPSRLRTRVLLAISLLFAVLFAAALILLALVQRHDRAQTLDRALNQAQTFATAYERVLGDQLNLLNAVIALPEFDLHKAGQCSSLFAAVVANHGALLGLAAVDPAGGVLCDARGSAAGAGIATHPAFRRAVETGQLALGNSLTLGTDARHAVLLARPLLDRQGAVHAVLISFIDQDWLNRRFADTVPAGVVLRILDAEGTFLVRQPNPECCVGRSGLNLLGIREALAGGKPHVAESVWLDSVRRLQADIPLGAPLSGVVSIGVPVELLETSANRGLFYAAFALLALCLILYLLAWAGTQRYILRPMQVVADTVHRLRAGALDSRVPPLPGHDEFDTLGADFNAMADALALRQTELEESGRHLEKALAYSQLERDMLERVAADGRPLPELLAAIAAGCERLFPGMLCSILLLDADGRHLRHGAAPSLPASYIDAIDGAEIGPQAGSCGTAAHTRRIVIVEDIASDPLWPDYRSFALAHDLRACWSVPILSSREEGAVLGTLALYYREPRAPQPEEIAAIERGAYLASLAIERQRTLQSMRLAASVFDQANEAITITDEKANIVAVSRRFTAITGYRADEVIGRNPRFLQSGRQDAAFYQAMWSALNSQGHWSGEIWNRRKDGSLYPEWLSISAVRDDAGKTTNYVGVFTDLTERVAAEAAIRASEQWHRSMLDNAPEGVWIIGPDECTIEVNLQLCELLGYTGDEMRGRKPTDFADEANSAIFELQKTRRWATRKRNYEIALRHRDGHNIPVQFSATSLLDDDGSLMAVLAFVTDLSQRKRDEQILRESEARHRLIVDTALDAVVSMGSDGCVTEWNGEAERMFGYRREAALGRPIADLIVPPRLREAHWSGMRRFLDTGKGRVLGTRIETTAMRASGSEFPVELAIATVGDGSGLFFSAFIRDITDRKRLEEETRRHRQELELRVAERTQALQAANRELEAFSYSVSHDLRAPLRAINGFSHLLEEEFVELLDDKGRHYLSRVRAGSERMGQLIDDLLKLSQMTRQPMNIVPTSLSDLAAEIAAELQAGEPGRSVEWIVAPDVAAEGDAGLLRAVLLNLLANAWKYSSRREQARIEFGVCRKDGQPVYFVRDNGAGFDMAHAGRLFGAFQRLHSPTEFPGSGIGLATVARIVHRHGGEVWAEGAPDAGATFYFTLPPRQAMREFNAPLPISDAPPRVH